MLELKTQLLQNIRSCLFYLLPGGTFRGDKFYVGDVQGNKGKSTVIELTGERAGLWKDFATGEGGDIIDLWATVHGKNAKTEFPEVMLSISEWLGIKEKNNIRDLEQYLTCSWNYYDENNQLIVIVYRYDPPLEKKQFKPFDAKKQRFKEPEIRPLYNIPGILNQIRLFWLKEKNAQKYL